MPLPAPPRLIGPALQLDSTVLSMLEGLVFSHVEEEHEPLPMNLVFPCSCCSGRTTATATAAEVAYPRLQSATRRYVAIGVATISSGRMTQEDRQRLGRLLAGNK